jgi:nucleoside-diphosphate-sugar epimerase
MSEMSQVLIVGSSGYIADNLYQNIKSKHKKIVLASSSHSSEYYNNEKVINLNQSTLRIISEIIDLSPTEIIYCSSKYINDSLRENFYVNLYLPLLISAISRFQNIRFIYFGSYWQLYPLFSKKFVNRYTISKSIMSFLLRILNWRSGNKISLLIICDTFGKDDKRNKVIPYLLKCEKYNADPIINNPNNYINLTHVNNVVQNVLKILNSSDTFCYYCINEESVKVSDLKAIIHKIYLSKIVDEDFEAYLGDFFVNTERALKISKKFTSKMLVVSDLIDTVQQFKKGGKVD